MTTAVAAVVMMTRVEARACVDRIKGHCEGLAAALAELHDREGWRALGYETWRDCIYQEFNLSKQRAHQLLNLHTVAQMLASTNQPGSTLVDPPRLPETHARELARLRDDPERMRSVHAEVQEATGGKPKTEDYRQAVSKVKPRSTKPARSVRSSAEGFESQDLPSEYEFPVNNDTLAAHDDLAGGAGSQEAFARAPFCSHCAEGHRTEDCPHQAPPASRTFPYVHAQSDPAPPAAPDRPEPIETRQDADDPPGAMTAGDAVPSASSDSAAPATPIAQASGQDETSGSSTSHEVGKEEIPSSGCPTRPDAWVSQQRQKHAPDRPIIPERSTEVSSYRPPKVDGVAPVYAYPTAEGMQHAVESHLGGIEFDAFDRWYLEHRKRVHARRQMNGQAVPVEAGRSMAEIDAEVSALSVGLQRALIGRIAERLTAEDLANLERAFAARRELMRVREEHAAEKRRASDDR